jgi:hypothetical protein
MAKDDHDDLVPKMNPSEMERKEALLEATGPLWVCRHCRRENPYPYGECLYCGKYEDGIEQRHGASEIPLWKCAKCFCFNSTKRWHCSNCGAEKPKREDWDKPKDDPINQPRHYASFEVEPVEFVARNGLDFLRGNAIKYLCRAFLKGGAEDLKKALRYVQMALEHHYGVHVPIRWNEEREVEGLNWNLKGGNR